MNILVNPILKEIRFGALIMVLAFWNFENEDLVEHQNTNSQLSKRNMIRMSQRVFVPFIFFFISLLKDNCFTEFCCFLSNLNMKSAIGIHISLPFWTSLTSSPNPTPLGWYRDPVWVAWAIQQICLGYLFYIW